MILKTVSKFALPFLAFVVAACASAPDFDATPDHDADDNDDVSLRELRSVAATAMSAETASARRVREYVDARWYFTTDADIEAWYALTRELEADFDDVCGDTFCEGDYSNYQSLGIRCSVELQAGTLGACVWTFAGSMDEVVPATGAVRVAAKTWRCKLPIVRNTPVAELVQTLAASAEGPLRARLPGTEASLYDGLVECL